MTSVVQSGDEPAGRLAAGDVRASRNRSSFGEAMRTFLAWAKRIPSYAVLAVMAAADAYVFWNTLARIVQHGVEYLWVFVAALSLGAVVACEVIGRLVRRRIGGRGGSLLWVGVLATIWLSLGAMLVWIRSQESIASGGETGALAAAGGTQSWWQSPSVHVAFLMLALYLMTGALTITVSYWHHDPITKDERELIRRRQEQVRALLDSDAQRRLADGAHPTWPIVRDEP